LTINVETCGSLFESELDRFASRVGRVFGVLLIAGSRPRIE
jgi:hypothetical protein